MQEKIKAQPNAIRCGKEGLEVGETASPMDRVNATNLEAASRLQRS